MVQWQSPRLAALRQALSSSGGGPAALVAFWQELAAEGTPLIEPIPGDAVHLGVTFVWRAAGAAGAAGAASIALWGGPAGDGEGDPLTPLAGTDLFYRTYPIRADARFAYSFRLDGRLLADPLNRHPVHNACFSDGSAVVLPEAPPQPWLTPQPGIAAGAVAEHRWRSRRLKSEYPVWVYTPAGYSAPAGPYPLLLCLDGQWYAGGDLALPATLDNLIGLGLLPPTLAVMCGSFESEGPPALDALTGELLPWVDEGWAASRDPGRTAIAGVGPGARLAAWAALCRPDRFGHALCQSGDFRWRPAGDPQPEWLRREVLRREVLRRERGHLRFYLDVGLLEGDRLPAARRLREALSARGYPVHYAEFSGGHDFLSWPGTLATGLIALLGQTTT